MTDPAEILTALGAKWSPDFDAYASGQLDISRVRCVLCGRAPCECRQCTAIHENRYYLATGRPQFEVCGMTIRDGQCPRGHTTQAA
jgi:hypothetical protein